MGVPTRDLDKIKTEDCTDEECLERMLKLWLNDHTRHRSWDRLLDALQSPSVDQKDAACEIREELEG